MVSLHEAIRMIQDELIESERERIQSGISPLFKTEKLTIELACTFSETESNGVDGKASLLSVISLDGSKTESRSSENVQKITIEFSVADSSQDSNNRMMPVHDESGLYPYNEKG